MCRDVQHRKCNAKELRINLLCLFIFLHAVALCNKLSPIKKNFKSLFQILIIELVRAKLNLDEDRHYKMASWNVPVYVQNLYKYIGFFAFGASICQGTTDISKYTIGRLRPHFLTVSINIA